MSEAGVASVRSLAKYVDDIAGGLTPQEWEADSGCHGWRVQDVVCHMGFFFNFIADPSLVLPENPAGTAERLNDAAMRERAEWTPEATLDYYRTQAAAGVAALEGLQQEGHRDATVDLLDLGTYRLAQLSDAAAFDHLVHLTCDLLAPHGPLVRDVPALGSVIDPAIDWMFAGLPQMCGQALTPVLASPLGLQLTGDTERTAVLSVRQDGSVAVDENAEFPADVVISSAADFLSWGTARSSWRGAVTVPGNRRRVAPVLDAINIV